MIPVQVVHGLHSEKRFNRSNYKYDAPDQLLKESLTPMDMFILPLTQG